LETQDIWFIVDKLNSISILQPMISFVYLRNQASISLASELQASGYHVHDAYSVSEAVWLCTQQHLGIIVIGDNLEQAEIAQLQGRPFTFRLNSKATVKDLLSELELVMPDNRQSAVAIPRNPPC